LYAKNGSRAASSTSNARNRTEAFTCRLRSASCRRSGKMSALSVVPWVLPSGLTHREYLPIPPVSLAPGSLRDNEERFSFGGAAARRHQGSTHVGAASVNEKRIGLSRSHPC